MATPSNCIVDVTTVDYELTELEVHKKHSK